ncbi:dehydrogenase [Bacillus sp. HMF5848]|uniref:molybdopterin-dependent oxidoreductase n=1 Tax=Bacillus sp. HMF5848 TaxID=2495421 RepID=UPI000F7B8807|nr:molybdopterin-dependent oxidoreductase [Bacillus sp. HMF5848]RSK27554.1 dehydrogenase [Bacillus sp. HMF5848]
METTIFRNVCPRNCYGTCSMLTHVKGGKIIKVTGDPAHGYTLGKLCPKGYSYTQYVYHTQRLKYPMMQYPRMSGNWQRISWEKAYELIANKILNLNLTYNSNLAIGYNKFFGNMGLLHYAVEAMFNSFGAHTKVIGNSCLTTGFEALRFNRNHIKSQPPEKMADAKLIVIWGANPAVTNIQQLKFIFEAKANGAKLVVIDPIFTQTAMKADIFIQVHPGTDTLLALGIIKTLIESEQYDLDFIQNNVIGWKSFKSYIIDYLSMEDVIRKTGVPKQAITELAQLYATHKPAATWIGFGLQRYSQGAQAVRAIDSLVAISGNYSRAYHGMYYVHNGLEQFPLNLLTHQGPQSSLESRTINMNTFATDAKSLSNPPLKMLWIAARNPLSQDQNIQDWMRLVEQLDLVVTVDLFMTKTAEVSDIVLPTTTHFEEYDLNVSYWHHWLAVNQQAIEPYYEAKSDLQIARELTKKLNTLSPGFSNFPFEREAMDWIELELSDEIKQSYRFSNIEELFDKPRKLTYKTPDNQKHMLFSIKAKEEQFPAMPIFRESKQSELYPFRLLTPQALLQLHSQFEDITWFSNFTDECIEINEDIAKEKGISNGNKIVMYNDVGSITSIAKLNKHLPKNVIVMKQAGRKTVNTLISLHIPSHHNLKMSTPFYDIFIDIKKGGI